MVVSCSPCDGYYKRLYEEEKKKKEVIKKVDSFPRSCSYIKVNKLLIQESNDEKRSKAKKDVEELLGKDEKKKKKASSLKELPAPGTGLSSANLSAGTENWAPSAMPRVLSGNGPLGLSGSTSSLSATNSLGSLGPSMPPLGKGLGKNPLPDIKEIQKVSLSLLNLTKRNSLFCVGYGFGVIRVAREFSVARCRLTRQTEVVFIEIKAAGDVYSRFEDG
jgi:hypothetical protein